MSVKECQERVDGKEFAYWMAYNTLDPIGNDRADYHAALVAHTVASANSKKKLKFNDFVLKFGEEKKITDPAQILKYFKSISK